MPASTPSIADIERLAQAAVEALPAAFRAHLGKVVLQVVDFPDAGVMAEMELESPYDLLGLYQGYPVGDPGNELTGALPPVIHLYRQPLLLAWREGRDSLAHLVAHVVVHEIGHHFGLSDDDMYGIEAADDADPATGW